MKSTLSKQDFQKRLEDLTSKEKDFFFIPYDFSGKPFCGTYDANTFDLARNSILSNVRMLRIKGEFKESEKTGTDVTYQIRSPQWMNYLLVILNVLIFLGMLLLVVFTNNYNNVKLILTLSGVFVFGNGWVWLVNKITRSMINQRFKEEFEIGVEDEWERLARSASK
ncbi:MAG: hypothetical protein HYZ44_16430 [Bacteroidetes bacterium]|nr:hypothetical protein [Bacteroidota bacterium]